jgi:hypothetical protein
MRPVPLCGTPFGLPLATYWHARDSCIVFERLSPEAC